MDPHEIRQIGPYRVVDFLAEGGMAWVFSVVDPRFDVLRALKMLKPAAAEGDDFRRFQSEARLLASVEHPNLVTIYDIGRDDATGCHYYTMTFVDGPPLSRSGRLPWQTAVPVFLDVLAALAELHARGIVHRDVKPANVLRTAEGRALLGDLGIARRQEDDGGLTRTGVVIGSYKYMSPEQARGADIGPGSDVFSMGLAIYQVLTGASVYEGQVDTTSGEQVLMYLGSLLYAKRELAFDFPSDVPVPIARVVRTACRFDPQRRYPDAAAMGEALREAAARVEAGAGRTPRAVDALRGLWPRGRLAGGTSSWRTAAAAAVLAGMVGLVSLVPDHGGVSPAAREALDALAQGGASESERRAVVARFAARDSDGARDVLIAASRDPSIKVGVDAIKALGDRVDDTVAAHLVTLLDHDDFQRRAWAALGLGEAGRRDARDALEARRAIEPHAGVRQRIDRALARLAEVE